MSTTNDLISIAKNEQTVYDAGKKAEYDAFWDGTQSKGSRINYSYGFSGVGWTDKTFKPKYDIVPRPANGIFQQCSITNLTSILNACGVTLDLSQSDNNDYLFNGCQNMTHIPIIDLTGQSATRRVANYTFNVCRNLVRIEKVILPSDGSMTFTGTFGKCNSLAYIRFDGVIGNTISFSASPLDKDSFADIIAHLSDTVTGKTITFNKTAKEAAFTADEWKTLTDTKKNWTFSLV